MTVPLGLMMASACAMASGQLTLGGCNSYPFKPDQHATDVPPANS
jgi:hypothetical protein